MDPQANSHGRRAVYVGVAAEESFGYAQAVQVGDTIHVSGQLGLGLDGELVSPARLDADGHPVDFAGMEAQMRATYANASRLLSQFDATLADVVSETLFVLDVRSAFAVGGKVRKEAYASDRPKVASNLIGVSRLALDGQLLEIAYIVSKSPSAADLA